MMGMIRRFGAVFLGGVLFAFLAGCERQAAEGPTPANSAAPSTNGRTLLVSPEGAEASEPAIAAGADGRVFVAYVQKSGEAADLFVRAYDAAKGTPGDAVRVNPVAGQVKTWYGDPPTIAVGPSGSVHVGWTAKYPDGAKGTILYMSVSRDGGATFGAPVQVNDDTEPASHGMHSMAVANDGKVYFSWLDERYLKNRSTVATPTPQNGHGNAGPHPEEAEVEPNAELYYASSADGKTFGHNRKLAADVCPCCKTSTVVSDKGRVAIGYRKVFDGGFRHIAVTSLNDFGDAWSEPVQVSDDGWRIDACPVSGPALRFEGDALEVAWFSGADAGQKGVYVSRWTDPSGRAFEPRKLVAETEAGGSPSWAGERLLWSAVGKIGMWNKGGTSMQADGRNVVAAAVNGRTFYAFVSTEGEHKAVRLHFE
jgi:hypothetical protein